MTSPSLIERITRSLAFMLRHQPEQFDLELDAYGYADLGEVVQALNERLAEPVEEEDVVEAVESGDRRRYEIVGERIRALYGHSIEVDPGPASKPPEELFIALSRRDSERALDYGLEGGRRRFLHLALTLDDARESGRRLAREYCVLTVHALDAWEEGINFYDREALFLAEEIPTSFLEEGPTFHDGEPPRALRDERGPGGGRGHDREERGGSRRRRGGRGRDRQREDHDPRGGDSGRRGGESDAPRREHREAPAGERRPQREAFAEERKPQRESFSEERRPSRESGERTDRPRHEGGDRPAPPRREPADRGARPPRGEREDRGREGRDRGDREAPRRPAPPAAEPMERRPAASTPRPPAAPARSTPRTDGFGDGIFEGGKSAPKAPAPRPEPAPSRPAPAPKKPAPADDDGGFGAGI